MGRTTSKREASETQQAGVSLAKTLAPEEIARGDYVAVLWEVTEWPSWFWCDDALQPREEPVRICHLPHGEPQPLRVRAACLPLVLVKTPAGDQQTLDVRKCRLARLDRDYGRQAWRAYRDAARRREKAWNNGAKA